MKFEFIDLEGLTSFPEHPVPNEPVSIVNMHTSLYALFSISQGEIFDLAKKKLDELGVVKTAAIIGETWPPEHYSNETIKEYAELLLAS